MTDKPKTSYAEILERALTDTGPADHQRITDLEAEVARLRAGQSKPRLRLVSGD
jgi:hypothetical protein